MRQLLSRFCRDESGASMVEYALVLASIAGWIIYATGTAGLQLSIEFTNLKQALADAVRM